MAEWAASGVAGAVQVVRLVEVLRQEGEVCYAPCCER